MRLSIFLLCISPAFVSCSIPNSHYNEKIPHHTATGFKANYQPLRTDLTSSFFKWQFQRVLQGFPPDKPKYPVVGVKPNIPFLQHNTTATTVTWIGHASLLVQVNGLNILTDPVFSQRVSPLAFMGLGPKRQQPAGVALKDLPHIDVVVISHDHYDHLDLPSVKALYRQQGGSPQFFVPLGIDDWLKKNVTQGHAEQITAMDWWEKINFKDLQLQFLPVQHWGARSLNDRYHRLWGAWAIRHPQFSFFFGGDFGWSKDLADIGQQAGGFDLAALPIGAYAPRWFMHPQHIAPEQAIEVQKIIGARQAVAMHWGTFSLSDEPLDEPPRLLAEALLKNHQSAESFFVMKQGETRVKEGDTWTVVDNQLPSVNHLP